MPVIQGYVADPRTLLETVLGNEGNAHTRGHQVQGGLGGVHGADHIFVRRRAGCPLPEALRHVVVEYDLLLMDNGMGIKPEQLETVIDLLNAF